MIHIDVRSNDLTPETVDEINEIVMKNYLKQQKISYTKMSDSKSFYLLIKALLYSDG